MDPTLKMSLVFIAILTCHLITTSSAIKIKITTKRYSGVVPTSFNVTCTLDPDRYDYYRGQFIVGIEVSRNGQRPLVELHPFSEISYNNRWELGVKVKAKGLIGPDPSKIKMTVTFTDAKTKDNGFYTCTLVYFDYKGYREREADSANFTIEMETELEHQANDADTSRRQHEKDIDALNTQHEKDIDALNTQHEQDINTLKTQHEKQNKEMDALKTQLKTLENKMTSHITKVETELEHQANDADTLKRQHEKDIDTLKTQHEKDIDTLKTQLKTLENQTTNHMTKANLQSGFMAGLKDDDKLFLGTIKFRDVQLNIGNHFDANTSVYTAPRDGQYTFHLTVKIYPGEHCQLGIKVNGRTVSNLYAEDADNYAQSSVSAFVSLKVGDIVDVHGWDTTGYAPMHANPYPSTYFSGFLVKAT